MNARFLRIIDKVIIGLITVVGMLFFAALTTTVIMQVVSRMALNPFQWTLELAQFAVVITVFLGVGLAEKDNKQIKVEVIDEILPIKIKKVLTFIGMLITIFTLVCVFIGIYKMIPSLNGVRSPAAGIPVIWIYYLMATGVLAWVYFNIRSLIPGINDSRKEEDGNVKGGNTLL